MNSTPKKSKMLKELKNGKSLNKSFERSTPKKVDLPVKSIPEKSFRYQQSGVNPQFMRIHRLPIEKRRQMYLPFELDFKENPELVKNSLKHRNTKNHKDK